MAFADDASRNHSIFSSPEEKADYIDQALIVGMLTDHRVNWNWPRKTIEKKFKILIGYVKWFFDLDPEEEDPYTFEKMKSLVHSQWWDHCSKLSPKELEEAYEEFKLY